MSAAFAVVLALAGAARGGVIHGLVLEQSSGRPLARSKVTLQALGAGGALEAFASAVANRSGQFTFLSVPAGYYLVSSVRQGYAMAAYGQKRGNLPGTTLVVTRDSDHYIEMRLEKLGVITGRLVDENRVGLPGIDVVAYPVALPLRMAARARSDDRGVYRLANLPPGRYYIRTAAAQLEDGLSLLPTFSPGAAVAREAIVFPAELDRETQDNEFQPLPGRLHRISGAIGGCEGSARVTLSSDTGRRQTVVSCAGSYSFADLSPGDYELLAEGTAGGSPAAAFRELYLDRDSDAAALQLVRGPVVDIWTLVRGQPRQRRNDVPLIARRKDLAGEGPAVQLGRDRLSLAPGYWELTALPPPDFYLDSIGGPGRGMSSRAGQNPDWFEVFLGAGDFTQFQVSLAPRPAKLSGVVSAGAGAAVAAPVYLLGQNQQVRRRSNGLKMTRTDVQGNYRFDGLPPGPYSVLSTFDLAEITADSLAEARAASVTLKEGEETTRDLSLFKIRD